jgi:hypothetical protein
MACPRACAWSVPEFLGITIIAYSPLAQGCSQDEVRRIDELSRQVR